MLNGCSGRPATSGAVAFSHDIKHTQKPVSTAIVTDFGWHAVILVQGCIIIISGTDVFDARELMRRYLNLIGPLNFGRACTRKVPEVKPQFMHCLLFVNTRGQT